MSTQRTYVPKSKAKVQKTTFGDVLKLGFHAESLIAFVKQHANQAGYVNIDIVPRRETDQYGNTHSCVLNDWKPDASRARDQETPPARRGPTPHGNAGSSEPPFEAGDDSSIPF